MTIFFLNFFFNPKKNKRYFFVCFICIVEAEINKNTKIKLIKKKIKKKNSHFWKKIKNCLKNRERKKKNLN